MMDQTKRDEKVFNFFIQTADRNKKVNWRGLRTVLDHSLRTGTPQDGSNKWLDCCFSCFTAVCCVILFSPCDDDSSNSYGSSKTETVIDVASDIVDAGTSNGSPPHFFSAEVCQELLAMVDTKKSGLIGLPEFKIIWSNILKWKIAFALHDPQNLGKIHAEHFQEALSCTGCQPDIANFQEYTRKNFMDRGFIKFEQFVMTIIHFKTLKDKDIYGGNPSRPEASGIIQSAV